LFLKHHPWNVHISGVFSWTFVFGFKPTNKIFAFIELTSFKSFDSKVPSFGFVLKKIGFVLKNRWVFRTLYIYIGLRPDGPCNTQTIILLRLKKLRSFNVTWGATPSQMVNYHIAGKDQLHIHAIVLEKFLVLWNMKLGQMRTSHQGRSQDFSKGGAEVMEAKAL